MLNSMEINPEIPRIGPEARRSTLSTPDGKEAFLSGIQQIA